MLQRHSSRRSRLHRSVLAERLQGAASYDRIAGYFRSSLFEVAGEALASLNGPIRIVCNADIDPQDMATAAAAQAALRQSWCAGRPEAAPPTALPRYQALYDALVQRRIEVRILPDTAFGLIHGKAGVVRYADGKAVAFLGSVNESATAWTLNYELMWEDDDQESVFWVQQEFDALWNDPRAVDLAVCPFITQDLRRIIRRRVVEPAAIQGQPPDDAAAAAAVETPVYRREQGLWPHQKYFASLALRRHRLGGARLVLADQVGLGKTVQLAMAALLMALDEPDGGPILVLAPKQLLQQWQDELMELLQLPTAIWTGRAWVDENGVQHPADPVRGLARCPRRIGLVSQGLVVQRRAEVQDQLLAHEYTCVIVDEAHRARRRDIPRVDASDDEVDARPEFNRLMQFLHRIAQRTKSMLLATATPVQLHPVEAWDLLRLLSEGNAGVLGGWTHSSPWYKPSHCLAIASGEKSVPRTAQDGWWYVSDPMPSGFESEAAGVIRRRLNAPDDRWQFRPEDLGELPRALQRVQLEDGLLPGYGEKFNPLLRCIVRRTRDYLEQQINPVTGEYYLPRVEVRLFAEREEHAIVLGGHLHDAYQEAEDFCKLLQQRVRGAGFFKTLLLRRLGSSMQAGRNTVTRLLGREHDQALEEEDDAYLDEVEPPSPGRPSRAEGELKDFTGEELAALDRCLRLLQEGGNRDPKLEAIVGYLLGARPDAIEPWAELGCVLFSQYYDTVRWMGDELARRSEFAGQDIGLYAGSGRSGFWRGGKFQRCERDELKARVRSGELKLILGTDAASEGLNLQRLGTLINIDLPWNPTRLEQRKGRIQRIGQRRREVWIANLRYRGSVEDRVHQVLGARLGAIHDLFGQIPDTLEDVWIEMALKDEVAANHLINRAQATRNPFDVKYSRVEDANWEECETVLNPISVREILQRRW